MDVNLMAVLAATVGQFAFGALWYMPLFGNLWGKMHGFEKLTKAKQEEMQKKMAPYYGVQLIVTALTAYVLASAISLLPEYSPYWLAGIVWVGFVVPTQVSDVIFGGTDEKWISQKIGVQAFGSLGCLLVAAFILGLF